MTGWAVRETGWASAQRVIAARLAYRPADDVAPDVWQPDDTQEPPYTVIDAWTPPHELALPADVCERIIAASIRPLSSGNGTYFLPELTRGDLAAVVERFTSANDAWWRLDITQWIVGAKRYRPGQQHMQHQDLHAGAARRKLAGVVQLTAADDYTGGDLIAQFAHHREPMPRDRGTLIAFPGWTVHEVTPVTAGERWSLCVNGWGAALQ